MDLIKTVLACLGTPSVQRDINAVLGEPEISGETTTIPITEMIIGFEFGDETADDDATPQPTCDVLESGDHGEEGRSLSRQIAAIEVDAEGVRVQPIVDTQRVTLAAVVLSLWIFGWIGLTLSTLLHHDA